MRGITDQERIRLFMHALGTRVRGSARIYLTGGSSAVLHGWRPTTVDIDIRFVPELDEIFRQLEKLKEELEINIELAAPSDFIPELPGWEERSIYIGTEGKLHFYHYDAYSQALSKIERGHEQDMKDVESMIREGLVDADRMLSYFAAIEPMLYKYPALDSGAFSRAVHEAAERFRSQK